MCNFFDMASKRDLNRIKELKVEIPYYGELSTSESKEKESYKKLVVELKKELEFLEKKVGKKKAWADLSANRMNDPSVQVPRDDVPQICDLEQLFVPSTLTLHIPGNSVDWKDRGAMSP